jgi:hypothetical protein
MKLKDYCFKVYANTIEIVSLTTFDEKNNHKKEIRVKLYQTVEKKVNHYSKGDGSIYFINSQEHFKGSKTSTSFYINGKTKVFLDAFCYYLQPKLGQELILYKKSFLKTGVKLKIDTLKNYFIGVDKKMFKFSTKIKEIYSFTSYEYVDKKNEFSFIEKPLAMLLLSEYQNKYILKSGNTTLIKE